MRERHIVKTFRRAIDRTREYELNLASVIRKKLLSTSKSLARQKGIITSAFRVVTDIVQRVDKIHELADIVAQRQKQSKVTPGTEEFF